MVRVKPGKTTRRSHKKLLKLARGYRMSRHRQVIRAKEAVLHAGQYAYSGRKQKKRQFRSLWIIRLNGALREKGFKYSNFINRLNTKKIGVDRKILAQIAVEYPQVFQKVVDQVMSK